MPVPAVAELRRFAVRRSLFRPATLPDALDTLGFVQADPIRAPARAQDLTLRVRVEGYRAGELERRYPALGIEEDVFVNYGFVTRAVHALMHPRTKAALWPRRRHKRAEAVVAFVRERGSVHPRDVDAHFSHGTVTNYWGGSSNATTHLLDALHYQGRLRVVRRDRGIRVYAARDGDTDAAALAPAECRLRMDALVDVVLRKYAPLPAPSLSYAVGRLRYAAPQWRSDVRPAIERAKRRLSHVRIDGVTWYWPVGEEAATDPVADRVHLLAPFDPVVWDRRRFELFWGWPYRFEAYTPVARRTLGYYALPLLWRDDVVGWANVTLNGGALEASFGYVAGRPPRDRSFKRELEADVERMREFLRPPDDTV
jgi:uncharacterized protein